MKILNRYLASEVIRTTGLVMAVLLGIQCFMLLFNEISEVGKAGYSFMRALQVTLLQLPTQAYQLFPMAGFLGCLLGLGRLASSAELVVMRASGLSIQQIALSVAKAAMLMLAVMISVGEWVAPPAQAHALQLKAQALGKIKNYQSLGGVWLKNQDEFIYIGDIQSADTAGEVSTFRLRGRQMVQTQHSKQAQKQGTHWEMHAVAQTNFAEGTLASSAVAAQALETKFDPLVLALGQTSLDQLSTAKLAKVIHYRESAKLDVEQYRFVYWQRLFMPLVSLVMILLGVPFVFSAPRSANTGFRLLVGLMVGFGFYMLNQFLGPMAVVYQFPAYWVALTPVVLSLGLYAMLFRRIA